jgi:hypothetical protein
MSLFKIGQSQAELFRYPSAGRARTQPWCPLDAHHFTSSLACAVRTVDARMPVAVNKRTGISFGAGLGPHSEIETFRLIVDEARAVDPGWFIEAVFGIPYPNNPQQKCDLKVTSPAGGLFVEGKLLRLKGDNGKPNDNMLMHILSPYAQHRSALTDCTKLAKSQLPGTKAIIILGYGYEDLPLEPAIRAFEMLAGREARLGKRHEAQFGNLIHPVHRQGSIFAWSLDEPSGSDE